MATALPLDIAAHHDRRATAALTEAAVFACIAVAFLLPYAAAVGLFVSLPVLVLVGTAPALSAAYAVAAAVLAAFHAHRARTARAEHAARLAAPVTGPLYRLRCIGAGQLEA